jgi:hypothetical protein
MSISGLSDESLLRFHNSIRREVEADRESMRRGYKHFFTDGDGIKKYAANLRVEMERRRLNYSSIMWL